ncbi:MAG: hypothetical protein EBT99_05965 [Betaproteobacteria bacterium]|nr:hypothetical protein [Betaproteobacteria bacterium]
MIDKAFQMPGLTASGLDGAGKPFADMSQGLTWMQNMWSSYMSSPMAPTLDVDELDRRIKDLKAVEQWLAMNQGLLRTTIQGLEIQRAGMAGFQAMMASRSEQAAVSPTTPSTPSSPFTDQASQWWGFLQKQFEQLASHASLSKASDADDAPGAASTGSVSSGGTSQPDQAGRPHQDRPAQTQALGKASAQKQARRQSRMPRSKASSKAKPGSSL